jgi:signal peptidase I
LISFAGLLALLAFGRAHFRLCLVQGDSMLPGLRPADLLLVDKHAYRDAEPQRGDVVVASNGTELLVKRVVGLPGEEIELRLGELYVDDAIRAEPYSVASGTLSLRKGRLLPDRYALLGDNRSVSVAASVHAIVAKDQIVGKAILSCRLGWEPGRENPARDPGETRELPAAGREGWTSASLSHQLSPTTGVSDFRPMPRF